MSVNRHGGRHRSPLVCALAILLALSCIVGAAEAQGAVHVLERGQTLYDLARHYRTTVAAFMEANGLASPNAVWVGQRLRVPGPPGGLTVSGEVGVHVVQPGETLATIAWRYGMSAQSIVRTNSVQDPNFIWVGQRLLIPAGRDGLSREASSIGMRVEGRWIDVDLSHQRATAWQDGTLVRSMVVSTGIWRYPTPAGEFHIYAKYPSVTMSGPDYHLPGVPHTMFFYRGYALHGTYWHDSFGRPMSHGCINLNRNDAAWLYVWAPVGTQVVIHE